MKIGTKSLLFGVHQFLWHPITVAVAWRRLYRRWPDLYECISIFCHDLGYWGKPDMDGAEGQTHPEAGAYIACWITEQISFARCMKAFICRGKWRPDECWSIAREVGRAQYIATVTHSSNYARKHGIPPSPLCGADKACVLVEPKWFYLLRARLSGEIKEYVANCPNRLDPGNPLHQIFWLNWYREKVRLRWANATPARHRL